MGFLKKGLERGRIEDSLAAGHVVFMNHLGLEPHMDTVQVAQAVALNIFDSGATFDQAVQCGQWVIWATLRRRFIDHRDSPLWQEVNKQAEALFPANRELLQSKIGSTALWPALTELDST